MDVSSRNSNPIPEGDVPRCAHICRDIIRGNGQDVLQWESSAVGQELPKNGKSGLLMCDLVLPESQRSGPRKRIQADGRGNEVAAEHQSAAEADHLKAPHELADRRKSEQINIDFAPAISCQPKTSVSEIRGYIRDMLMGLTGELTPKRREYSHEMEEMGFTDYHLISYLLVDNTVEMPAELECERDGARVA